MCRRLGHRSPPNNGRKYVQVTQLEAASDARLLVQVCYRHFLYEHQKIVASLIPETERHFIPTSFGLEAAHAQWCSGAYFPNGLPGAWRSRLRERAPAGRRRRHRNLDTGLLRNGEGRKEERAVRTRRKRHDEPGC